MGGNDLNLKKSWHPQLMTNQRRVYDAEQAALQERKITEARLEEIRKERQIEETQKQLEAAGGPKRVDRVDWMYSGPNDNQGRDEYSSEAFLLGKRRIDSILRGDENKALKETAGPTGEAAAPVSIIASARDTAAKIREDPLVAIKRQEQEAYAAMMKDPSKRRQLLAQMGMEEETPKAKRKEDKPRKHRHHHRHRHHDDDSDGERRHKRRRSDSRDRSRSRRRYDSGDDDRRSKKRRSSTDRRDRSTSPRRRDDDRRERRRDRDDDRRPTTRRESTGTDDEAPKRRRDGSRDRRDGPRNGARDDYRRDNRNGTNGDSRRPFNNDNRNDRPPYNNGGSRSQNASKIDEEERARKLAAMQEDATDLDKAREGRLAALAEKEKADRDADNQARTKASKYGGDREFVNNLHRTAGNESLADRIGRGRQGMQRDED